MKTKILLRFLVTIVILAAVVLGVWLIWFKPSNELEVFNMLTELQNDKQAAHKKALDYNSNSSDKGHDGIKQNTGVSTSISDTYSVDDYGYTSTEPVYAYKTYYGQIAYQRAYMFNGFTGTSTNQSEKHQNPYKNMGVADVEKNATLESMYNTVDGAFKYYYSYVQLAEDVSNSEVKEIKNIVKALNASYDSFASNVDEVYAIIGQYNGNNSITVLSETASLYKNLTQDYYSIVKLYTDLTIATKDFVVKHVFDGNTAYDIKTVSYNAVLNSVNELTEKELKVFDEDGNVVVDSDYVKYSTDVVCVINTASIDSETVKVFANIAKNYAEGLTGEHGIFKLSREDKLKIVNADAEAESWYNETYFNDIKLLVEDFFKA